MNKIKIEDVTNKIILGDNLLELRKIPDNCIDLIYLDPPFFSGPNYEMIWKDEDKKLIGKDIVFTDNKKTFKSPTPLTPGELIYSETHAGGIVHYILWMKERLKEMHRILKSTGSLYLHCDWHASHYLKIEMDKIFGYNNFQNEIVWGYTSLGAKAISDKFGRSHDVLLFYTKTDKYNFKKITKWEKYESSYQIDNNGKAFYTSPRGDYTDKSIEEMKKENKIYITDKGTIRIKYFLTLINNEWCKERLLGDVWTDINDLMHISKSERLGYPTQKPLALLDRIIKASSNENDIVLDPFCGCGTTLAVCQKLNRKWIGIDVSLTACRVMAKRIGVAEKDIIGIPKKIEIFQQMLPHEFQHEICKIMLARNTSPSPDKASGGDGGKDGIIKSDDIRTGDFAGGYLQVKQSKNIGVNAIRNLYAVMLRNKIKKGVIVAFSFGSGAIEEVASIKNDENIEIRLVEVEELLNIEHYKYPGVKDLDYYGFK